MYTADRCWRTRDPLLAYASGLWPNFAFDVYPDQVDIIFPNGGGDTIDALDGDDFIVGGTGGDDIDGGDGTDTSVHAGNLSGYSLGTTVDVSDDDRGQTPPRQAPEIVDVDDPWEGDGASQARFGSHLCVLP